MKRTTTIFLALAMAACSVSSCYYDKKDLVYPLDSTCDTSGVTYTSAISGILTANHCMECHTAAAGPSLGGGIVLDSYSNASSLATTILGQVSGTSPAMPKGYAPLSSCDVSKIKAWINAATPK